MNGTAYRLLGFAVWNGGKWYLRRRLPGRRIALGAAVGAGALAGAAVLAKRLSG